jgi:hypothetical protein
MPSRGRFWKRWYNQKGDGIILNMWNRIQVRDGSGVQGTVISTRPPTAVLLGHEMEGG